MLIDCQACKGLDDEPATKCGHCHGRGQIVLADKCPLQQIPAGTWQVLRLADWAEQGAFPVAGGILDQTASFMAAMTFIRQVEASLRQRK